jgi:16S rRNA G1207 methylase RsmC
VWAVDVNERSLDLTRRNADALGLSNINVCRPEDVPDTVRFRTIWSNPPIRVGKNELHAMLTHWLPRLDAGSDAWLVVQRNLGSDSLHRWLQAELPADFSVLRAATSKGYRVGIDLKYVVEQDAEHTETAWARRLPDALRFLLRA